MDGFLLYIPTMFLCHNVFLDTACDCVFIHFLVSISLLLQYRIHILTTPWWKHLSYYVLPVSILSLIFNIPMFINLQVYCYVKNVTVFENWQKMSHLKCHSKIFTVLIRV